MADYTVSQAARYCNCNRQVIYAAVRDGRLQAYRTGERAGLRITQDALDAWRGVKTEEQVFRFADDQIKQLAVLVADEIFRRIGALAGK